MKGYFLDTFVAKRKFFSVIFRLKFEKTCYTEKDLFYNEFIERKSLLDRFSEKISDFHYWYCMLHLMQSKGNISKVTQVVIFCF